MARWRDTAMVAASFAACASCAALTSWDAYENGSGGGSPPKEAGGGDDGAPGSDAGPDAPHAGPEFVQVNSRALDHQTVSSLSAPFTSKQNAGDLVVVLVGWYDGATPKSVSDTAGNTYRVAVPAANVGPANNRSAQAIFYASGIKAADANANTVTVQFDNGTDSPDLRIVEYRGVSPTEPLAGTSTNSGTSKTVTSGALVVGAVPAVVVVGGTTQDAFTSAGNGFLVRTITSGGALAADAIVSTAGTYAATTDLEASDTWVVQLAAFR